MSDTTNKKTGTKKRALKWEEIITSWEYALRKSMKKGDKSPRVVDTMLVRMVKDQKSVSTDYYGYWGHFFEKLEELLRARGEDPALCVGAKRDHTSIRNKVKNYLDKGMPSDEGEKQSYMLIKSICSYRLMNQPSSKSSVKLDSNYKLLQNLSGSGEYDWSK